MPDQIDLSNLPDKAPNESGNVDLYAQPKVKNPDGSTSTVDSSSYNIDGKEVLLPSVTPDGRHLKTDDEILNEYKKTGRHLGKFNSVDEANKYAEQLHNDYAAGKYDNKIDLSNLPDKPKSSNMFSDFAAAHPDITSAANKFLFGPSDVKDPLTGQSMGKPVMPGMESVLPNMRHPANEGWPGYLARGAYNTLIAPLGSASGFLGAASPTKAPANIAEEIPKPVIKPPENILPEAKGNIRLSMNLPSKPTGDIPLPPPPTLPPASTPPIEPPNTGPGMAQKLYDLPRGLMSVDPPFMTSAAFRQASPFVGTKPWFSAWKTAAQSYGSKEAAEKINAAIFERPLFKTTINADGEAISSYADKVGLRIGDLAEYAKRDEAIRGELAEKIPLYGKHVAGNNRAFNAFLNTVSADTFENLINDAAKLNRAGKSGGLFGGKPVPNPMENLEFGQQIADFVNTALKRGKLGIEMGSHEANLEEHARLLSNTFFSPRSISSEIRMLNPSTYATADPFVRKQYLTALVRRVGTWWTMAGLSTIGGATVSTDPTSADFGKIKIGNTRIDPPGGLQQFLVLGTRELPRALGGGGITSTISGQFNPFGTGYKPETRFSTLQQFGINRLHPTAKAAADLLSATQKQPFHVADKSIQLVAPMFADDLMDVARENPELAPLILGLSGSGMGTQSYERGSFGKPTYWPEEYDWNIGK